ncbi:MAG: twin-arginine translocase TatA/TatE family subunit [Dehalococcoidia bacterium]|nr:twin-arginine translocase TatA/TatE family subunit [Dehalococcoidia bacterium]MDW8120558.1 twin-arginine translocase TatA/TatE family subunit [Chloroflexota bacterium]
MFRGGIGLPELIIILVIVLLLFGATRLPKLAESMGRAVKAFRKAAREEEQSAPRARRRSKEPTKV